MKKDYKMFEILEKQGMQLYFAKDKGSIIDIIAIYKHGEDDFGYWLLEISSKDFKNNDINTEEFAQELHNKLFYSNDYECEGCSSRGSLEDLEEIKNEIPDIIKIVSERKSQLLVI